MHARSVRLVLVVGALGLGAGCKKSDSESLIVAQVVADSGASSLTSLALSAGGVRKTFVLSSGLSATAMTFGLYVPSNLLGNVTVTAIGSGVGCSGYEGGGTADLIEAGATSNLTIQMAPSNVCTTDGGAGSTGTGGSVGAGGTSGTGGNVGTGGGSGGATGLGGAAGTGGTAGTGGAVGTGGTIGTGGAVGTGGSGGSPGKGGAAGSGTGGTTSTGGGSGAGGATGTGGSGPSGCASTPAVGTPPLLTCCQEYNHADSSCTDDASVQGVAFSPDGTLLATAGSDKVVKIWSFDGHTLTATGTTLKAPGTFVWGYVAFSPDGKYLAVGADGEVDIYNVGSWTAAGPPLALGDANLGVAFAPDSQHVISFDGDTVYVHTVGTAAPLTTQSPNLLFSSLAVGTVATTGGLVVAIGGDELFGGTVGDVGTGVVYLLSNQYALNAGVTLRTLTTFQENTLYAAAVSPDGATVAFGDYKSQIWFSPVPSANSTIPETSSLTVDAANYQSIYGIAYSPKNGRYLAAAAGQDADGNPGTLTIWDVTAKSLYAHYAGVSQQPIAVTFSPSGNAVVVGEYDCGKVLLCTN
ncbi:MAG TPA: hypothetical protein VH853_02380 [Polyangia bacterium]|nr:hypothetical protein [Polyangia bacterium]